MCAKLACSLLRWQGCSKVWSGARQCTLLRLSLVCLLAERHQRSVHVLSLAAPRQLWPLPASTRAQAWARARVAL